MRDFIKKVSILFMILFLSIPLTLASMLFGRTAAAEGIDTTQVGSDTKITQNGCYRKIEKTEKIAWSVPRQPIDLVILQDASGSFEQTIPSVKEALKRLTTYVTPDKYNEKDPHLVKTNEEKTTDRVFVSSYQGLDQIRYFNNNEFSGTPEVFTRENITGKHYQYGHSALTSDQTAIHKFIDDIKVEGGTPTVPAVEDTIAEYNKVKGNMENGRKTVFLLVTDGVANGYRLQDGNVVMDKSYPRTWALQNAWSIANGYYPEGAQDVVNRAKELKEAGNKLKAAVGNKGSVVIGFWELVEGFTSPYYQYGDAYLNGYNNAFEISDKRPVQTIFHEALESMASPDKEVNGKNVSFYVNEQSDIKKFSNRILESVMAALIKEDITGEFDITPGYKVDAIRINGKKIVSEVKDETKEVRGKIVQTGDKVKISVPESIFNPGDNKFDYDLSKEARALETDEEDEVDPPADYVPKKETVPVPELTGKFKAGEHETAKIGGSNETVEVQELAYCYPSVKKKITDKDPTNDLGEVDDPLQLTKKKAYSAQLTEKAEEFTYTLDYNFNNVPHEFKQNVMLTDPLDYRLEVVGHHASGPNGTIITRVVTQKDAEGNQQEVVVADVPSVNGYSYLLFKQAQMTIKVRLKEQYRKDQASKEYMAILQESDGFGLLNQGNIMWNGEDNTPDPSKHAKTTDKPSTIRRSNPVYVKPPLVTEVAKKVNDKDHEDLKTEDEVFEYKVTAPWPGVADNFTLTDTVVPELEVQADSVKAKVGGKDNDDLQAATSVSGQTVSLTLDKTGLEKITRKVNRRKVKDVQNVELTFKAKIRPGADLSKYKKDGQIKVPNTADVLLNDIKKTSNEVTVTPPKSKEPSIDKKINENLDTFQTFDGQPYNYNITTLIPSDIANYKKFVIRDTLNSDLELADQAKIKGATADLFDIQVKGQEITATVKDGKFADLAQYNYVELEIPAKVKAGVVEKTIDNKASIHFTNESGVEKELETKPVTVTPPPVTKKINETLDHLDIATGQAYNYNIKTKLPTDITDYKKFVITDTLDGDLSVINETSSKPAIKGATAAFFDVAVDGQTVTATMKDFANAGALAGQEVELIIPAKINDGVTRVNIPNTAKFNFTDKNDHSGEKETKPVTVTPPSDPSVDKKINETLTEATIAAETDFTYNIKAKLPNDITSYKSFIVTDTLDENLAASTAVIKGDAAKFFDVKVDGQTVTATMKDFAGVGEFADKEVELVITAKVKKTSTLPAIENKATITFTNKNNQKGEKETKPVTVTPPPITKKVNGQEHADLGKLSEVFTYTIDSTVPHVADKFEISDEIVKELAFEGQASVTVDGQAVQDLTVKTEGQHLTVTFGKDQVKQYAGKAVQVSFKAKIKDGITFEALLAAYPNAAKDKPVVPNTANYIINDNPDSKKESTPVTVTPPPTTTPELKKEVNGAERAELQKRDEEFTYTLKTTMPANATVFEMTDELKEVLEFVGEKSSATVKIDGEDAGSKATVTISGQVIKVAFTEASVKADAGKSIEVNFKAKIRDEANLSAYVKADGKTEIPNTASYDIDHNPKYHKDSNVVPVTPPNPEEPEIKKDVNGKAEETLAKRDEVFTYNVKTTVPHDATAFAVTDTLVDVLEFAGTSSATLNGQALDASQIKVEGQTITLTLTEDQVKANGGQAVELTFDAKIKAGANLSAYVKEDGRTQIPNKASYDIDHNPKYHKDSNVVPVTPPSPEEPEIKKDVNGKSEETLAKRDEVFTYNVKTTVPHDATAFSVTDTLVDVLEFAGTSSAKLNGQALDASQIKVEGQTITLTLTEDQAKTSGGQAVELSFTAKIKAGANLSAYVKEDGRTQVPNTASYRVDLPNKPGFTKDSNVVPVTPPTPEEPEIKKDVNTKAEETLADRDQVFTYNVKTSVPTDATAFSVSDTLESVLDYAGSASATLNGQALDASQIKVEGQTITLTLTEDQVKTSAGQAVELSFTAKIKAGADLTPYLTERGFSVPNTASYDASFPHKPGLHKDSNKVPVIVPKEPEPEITKKINRTLDHLDVEYDAPYMYNVNTALPKDIDKYKEFTVTDTLEPVLAITDTPVAYVDGRDANGTLETSVEGNTVTVKVKDFARLKGFKEIQLYIPAKLKANSDLTPYKDQLVPNKATVNFKDANGQSGKKETKPVTVKPREPEKPTEPKPGEPAKTVGPEDGSTSGIKYTLPQALDTFRFDITTPVPADPTDENGNALKDQYGRLVKTELTNLTISDTINQVLLVNKDRIALKVENAQFDKLKVALQAQLDKVEKELKELTGDSTEESSVDNGNQAKVKEAEAKVSELKAKLEAAKAAQPATTETSAATTNKPVIESNSSATESNKEVASLEAELKVAEENLAKLQAPAKETSETVAPAVKKQQQEKLEKEIKQLKEAQEKLQSAIDKLSKVSNDRGELVGKELEAIANVTYDTSSNLVTVEISDKDVLEAMKGSTVRLVLYTNFKEGTDFAQFVTSGVPNTAVVSFNHNPKATNQVVVHPPVPVTPPAPNIPPAEGDVPPKEPGKTLPNTGSEISTIFEVLASLVLGVAGLLVWKRRAER